MSNLHKILDDIEKLVLDSKRIPLLNKTVVDEEKLLDLLDHLREQLPQEIEQARQLVTQRSAILTDAQRKAESMIAAAERQAKDMVQSNAIVNQAREEADRVKKEAEAEAAKAQEGADKYAEDVLSELESKVSRALQIVQNGRQYLNTGPKAL